MRAVAKANLFSLVTRLEMASRSDTVKPAPATYDVEPPALRAVVAGSSGVKVDGAYRTINKEPERPDWTLQRVREQTRSNVKVGMHNYLCGSAGSRMGP